MTDILVLDTSVFVSALLGSGGASRAVLRECLTGRFEPLMGAALLAEYESVLSRAKLFEHCALTPRERDAIFDALLSVCNWVNIYYGWRPNLPDESDNHLIELAVAGGARFLATKNVRDFARAELRFPNLIVCTPTTLLKEYR